jgi:hypothetical protein
MDKETRESVYFILTMVSIILIAVVVLALVNR